MPNAIKSVLNRLFHPLTNLVWILLNSALDGTWTCAIFTAAHFTARVLNNFDAHPSAKCAASTPRLLALDPRGSVAPKLEALQNLLPGVDVTLLMKYRNL